MTEYYDPDDPHDLKGLGIPELPKLNERPCEFSKTHKVDRITSKQQEDGTFLVTYHFVPKEPQVPIVVEMLDTEG